MKRPKVVRQWTVVAVAVADTALQSTHPLLPASLQLPLCSFAAVQYP